MTTILFLAENDDFGRILGRFWGPAKGVGEICKIPGSVRPDFFQFVSGDFLSGVVNTFFDAFFDTFFNTFLNAFFNSVIRFRGY